ncbi:MAG TPA: hypothetical protein VHY37_10840 [Tepidisphaeraceae bacterium]|nr:hypothetical protein [Tepidisphaeraceae bacterium]
MKTAGPAARIELRFFDSIQIEFDPRPAPIALAFTTNDWNSFTGTVAVPTGATSLNIVLSVPAGLSADVDAASISVVAGDASDAAAYSTAPVVDGVAIRRDGGQTIFGDGTPTVWFIHPYVDVLGHDFADGIRQIIRESGKRGHPIAIGCAMRLDPAIMADLVRDSYVFSYKNIDYPLPANAQRLIFLNTWLRPNVQWPGQPSERKIVYLGSRTLGNDGDGKAADKERWNQIAKDDPALSPHVLDGVGYYLPLKIWTKLVLDGVTPAATQP